MDTSTPASYFLRAVNSPFVAFHVFVIFKLKDLQFCSILNSFEEDFEHPDVYVKALRLVPSSSCSLHPRISRSDFYAQRPVVWLHFQLFWARNEHHICRLMWIPLKIRFFTSFFIVFFNHSRL